jgi:hypothetical protein
MCTVTLLPVCSREGPVLRVAFNRDESRRRIQAIPPRRFAIGSRSILMPIDPESTGTWIALSDAGIALAIMNINPRHPIHGTPRKSRGAIIPALLHADSLEQMRDVAGGLAFSEFAPFRLLLANSVETIICEHNGHTQRLSTLSLREPLLFTSSGLGDHLVEPPRRQLFNSTLLQTPAPSAQDAFHRHHWPDCPHLSVCMSRSDARTVSHTLIHLAAAHATLSYLPDSPEQPLYAETHHLTLRQPEPACT